jgi:ceramide glucosyltransferase
MRPAARSTWLDHVSTALAVLYAIDRTLKLATVVDFFQRPAPPAPVAWPSISLLQPITRGASDLAAVLAARGELCYGGTCQHLLICDGQDGPSLALCRQWIETQPVGTAELVIVDGAETAGGTAHPVASKIAKLQAALPRAKGEVLCFVDDDVAPRPDALATLAVHLLQPDAGAVFGLACYVNWRNRWSSLMSGFVNANALMSYVPLAYLTAPYTITGHIFALRRTVFDAAGGLDGMERRLDDDHELARRVRRLGLRCEQTPVVYDVDNYLVTRDAYANQMQRWFTIPRVTMAPHLTRREQAITLAGSAGNLIPPLVTLLALLHRRRSAWQAVATSFGCFAAAYLFCERGFTHGRTPLHRWPLVLVAALIAPLQALAALLGGNRFEWRGQQVQLNPNGEVTIDTNARTR